MGITVVQYRTTPEAADENAELIGKVFAELAATTPEGLRYQAFRLADGVTFVHVAEGEDAGAVLGSVAAFRDFQKDFGGRAEAPPQPSGAELVGRYGHDG